jgi:hypothetical protein
VYKLRGNHKGASAGSLGLNEKFAFSFKLYFPSDLPTEKLKSSTVTKIGCPPTAVSLNAVYKITDFADYLVNVQVNTSSLIGISLRLTYFNQQTHLQKALRQLHKNRFKLYDCSNATTETSFQGYF